MRWDKSKLQELSENLEFNLKESIYRNAFPISIDRVDIANASLSDAFSTQFIKQLLGNAVMDAEIQASDDFSERFHHLYIEHINQKKDEGSHQLGFGYPLLIHKEEHSLFPIASPLFIWDIDLEPSQHRTNTWSLKRNASYNIRPNRFAVNLLKDRFNVDILESAKEIINDGLDGGKLSAFCNNISIQMDIPGNTSGFAIIPSPSADEIKDWGEDPQLRFSGTLGIYGQDHLMLSHHLKEKLENEEEETISLDQSNNGLYHHPFSLVKPDPCQKNIALQVMENATTVAEGGAGTGKTHTAIHVASNALANGKTCLIVSSNKSSLEQIHSTLNTNHIGALSYLFKDANNDLTNFYYALKQSSQNKYKPNKDRELGFKILLERVLGKHDKINAHHDLMNRQAFGTFDFTDTVGHYIESSRHAGKDILSGKLNAKEYKFTFREYDILKTDINKGERLYQPVKRLDHPLQVLHEELFLNREANKSEAYINKQLAHFKYKTEELLGRFTDGLESYRDNLREHYESHARELNEKQQNILNKIGEYAQVFGDDFKKSSSTKLQMYGVFSDTYFNIKEARREINEEFSELEDLYNEKRYFNYKFPKKKEVDTILNIQQYLIDFGNTLMDWTDNIPLGVRQESNALNSKSVQIQLDYKSRIGELEYLHDVLLEELNQIKLFREWFSYDGITLTKRLDSLENLWVLLDKSQRYMPDFQDFYPWQRHWLEILPISKETIKALVRSHAKQWLPAFNSWYYYNCLSDRSFLSAAVNDHFRNDYMDELTHLRNQLPTHIHAIWSKKKSIHLDQLKKRDKKLYQILTSKKAQLPAKVSLKDLFGTLHKELPSSFPIMMMTPNVAEELLTQSDIQFDLIIFDDAHLISTVQALPITQKSERILAIGDRRQSLYHQNVQIFMNTLAESGMDISRLYYKHINNERACSDFINYTTYQKSIKSINYFTKPYQRLGIHISPSEGSRYNEENRSNALEAEHLVRILAEMPSKNDGQMPHTAIVTNTLSQRDHISAYLLYLKQKRNPFSDKIVKLEESGLRVLHVSELKQHYETVVWSMTYGTTNLRGNITQHFQDMESSFGQSALNIILGHTQKDLIICTSIPKSYVDEQMEQNISACGPVIQFLKYADITSALDDEKRYAFLEEIEWPGAKKNERDMNKFMAQIKDELEPYFESDRIKLLSPLSEVGTAAITIIPLDYKQPIPLIIGDALDRNMKTVASEFERSVYKKLKEAGYKIFKTNSLDWWRNPKREARMLASRLIKADNTPAEVEKIP